MEIELQGMAALLDKLQAARVAMAGPEMRKALRAGGKVIQAAMEERAPVLSEHQAGSNQLPPGALRAGMRTQVPQSSEPLMALIGPDSKVEHVARFVEYGHRNVSGGQSKLVGDGSKTRGPPARPALTATASTTSTKPALTTRSQQRSARLHRSPARRPTSHQVTAPHRNGLDHHQHDHDGLDQHQVIALRRCGRGAASQHRSFAVPNPAALAAREIMRRLWT